MGHQYGLRMRAGMAVTVCTLVAAVAAGSIRVHVGYAAQTLVVTTTAGSTPPCQASQYSMACAIGQANADGSGDTITFNIPTSDPGCAPASIGGTTVSVCKVDNNGPALSADLTTIDGYTQPGAAPNTAPVGRRDNAVLTIEMTNGLALVGQSAVTTRDTVEGLSIVGGYYGIQVGLSECCNANASTIKGNFIGVSPNGARSPNGMGVYVVDGGAIIGGGVPADANVISGNRSDGIAIDNGNVEISGNYIGTAPNGSHTLGNAGVGIDFYGGQCANGETCTNGTGGASGNVVGGNGGDGIDVGGVATPAGEQCGTSIEANYIGTNALGTRLGNLADGVHVNGGCGNTSDNTIAYNAKDGVQVDYDLNAQYNYANSPYERISSDSIFSNGALGIETPIDVPVPVILGVTTGSMTGTACVGCSVEVYAATNESDDHGAGEGKTFLGSAQADTGVTASILGSREPVLKLA